MEGRLPGRVVVITGGCGDIGRATAAAFAREGAKVILVDLLSPGEARTALGATDGDPFVYIRCDVRDRASVRGMIATVEREHGGPDVAIVNAGITRSTPALAVSQDEWAQVLDVNLAGVFHVAQEAAAAMVRQQRAGALLFTRSWVGEAPSRGLLP